MFGIWGELEGGGNVAIVYGLAIIFTILLSFTLHEFSHAFVAYKCGDPTAKEAGRLTVNPFRHMDPIGMICCFIFGFGWAKPVPINPLRFRNFKRGLVLTSIAGVTMNFILAFFSAGAYVLMIRFVQFSAITSEFVYYLALFGLYFFSLMTTINLTLCVFNLLPIYPLDGFRVVEAVTKYSNPYVNFMRRYGTLVMLIVVIFGSPLISMLMDIIGWPIEAFWGLFVR